MATVVVTASEIINVEPTATLTTSQLNDSLELHRDPHRIVFTNCSRGLGIKIVGGCSKLDESEGTGIFVKRVIPGGIAAVDGQLQQGDLLLSVNGESLQHVTNERAVSLLRQASADNYVELLVCHDDQTREDFQHLLTACSYSSSSSLCDHHSISSRVSTPSIHDDQINWQTTEPYMTAMADLSQSSLHDYNSQGLNVVCSESSCDSEAEIINGAIASSTTPPPFMDFTAAADHVGPPTRHGLLAPSMFSTPLDPTEMIAGPRLQSPGGVSGLSPNTVNPDVSLNTNEVSVQNGSPNLPFMSHDISAIATGTPADLHSGAAATSQEVELDENVKLKIEKLEVALRYLGLKPSLEQQTQLRKRLAIESDGVVTYGQFVEVARELFKFELDERHFTPGAQFEPKWPSTDTEDMPVPQEEDELTRLRRQNEELRKEAERLKVLLREKESACNMAEEELLRVRREAQGAVHESRALRSQLALAEQAQQASLGVERDYEEVVKALEAELAAARAALDKSVDSPAVQKRLMVLQCQLRKVSMGKKTYEVATDKLMRFAELVHETLAGQGESIFVGNTIGESSRGSLPPSYAGKHRRSTPNTLARQAREVVMAVKELLEADPLPFGWDEAYTPDGMKYFINHVTQTTAWQHPVSKIQHADTGCLPPPSSSSTASNGIAETQT